MIEAPSLSALTPAKRALVVAWGSVLGAQECMQRSRARAAALSGTPCARWAHLHLIRAHELAALIDDLWPSLHEALRASLLEQKIADYEDARVWAECSARLMAERESLYGSPSLHAPESGL